ncbi:MAG: xanthine phosphoribosyltransferase [Clostridia bacterium]|nr:xanthine phosphoribosyltransferase [Clostridia bacterium]
MKLLEERILKDGVALPGDVLKVDSFLNHQIDVALIKKCGEEWHRLYEGVEITKIITIEASGIGIACVAADYFNVPVVFAKKSKSLNLGNDCYTAEVYSYTKAATKTIMISKKYISETDKVLIIDDFLANGSALRGLISIIEQAGATVAGIGIAVEKEYQGGGNQLRAQGYRIESLAKISSMTEDGKIEFCS